MTDLTKEIHLEKLKRLRKLIRQSEFMTNRQDAYNVHLRSSLEKVCKRISNVIKRVDSINSTAYLWETHKLNMHYTSKDHPDDYAYKIAFSSMVS